MRFQAGRAEERIGDPKRKRVGRPTGSEDSAKEAAFLKLIEHIDHDRESDGQYTGYELQEILNSHLSGGQEVYSYKHLKRKLLDHYGNSMIVTSRKGKETIFTFLDEGNSILREHYKFSGLTKEEVIDMAATLIADDIQSHVYDCTKYQKFSNMGNKELIPETLSQLIGGYC